MILDSSLKCCPDILPGLRSLSGHLHPYGVGLTLELIDQPAKSWKMLLVMNERWQALLRVLLDPEDLSKEFFDGRASHCGR